jgi:hypothetical protein
MIQAAEEELTLECDYINEANAQKRFRSYLANDPSVYVPLIIDDLSSKGYTHTHTWRTSSDNCVVMVNDGMIWL